MSLYAPRTSFLLSFEFLLYEYHHDNGNISEEEAALIVSSASLNLLMQEDLDVSEG